MTTENPYRSWRHYNQQMAETEGVAGQRSYGQQLFKRSPWFLFLRQKETLLPSPASRPVNTQLQRKEQGYFSEILLPFSAPQAVGPTFSVLFISDRPVGKGDSVTMLQPAGQELLGKMAQAMKLGAEEFSLTVALQSGATGAGDQDLIPLWNEIYKAQCQMCIPLGAVASNLLLGKPQRLTEIHGQFFNQKLIFNEGTEFSFQMMPLFHPDFLLVNPQMKKAAWADLQKVMKYLGKI
jgi:hypothetical protein